MNNQNMLPPIIRIRCVSGEQAGTWLWSMSVSRGGMPFQVIDWNTVLSRPEQYQFHPTFVETESAAFRPVSIAVAEGYVRALKLVGIDAEIVTAPPPLPVTAPR
jgi:hypothetical protein